MTDSLWLSVRVVCGPQWYCLGRKLCSRGNSQKLNIEITRQAVSERGVETVKQHNHHHEDQLDLILILLSATQAIKLAWATANQVGQRQKKTWAMYWSVPDPCVSSHIH